ncbi:indolepyruvate oxidoreductase subunit beta [Desulfurococcus mucosus]|uniref:Pyruvate/ketoisovalerate oxidoreductase, catalytic domain protein n=1 Tax=Desulfurococcus mucosus (strain ATCC 35584 / DSM 2162 / JCM 9187 / O7/1) TaxID=765177 RepID=E8R998_DESM0|nr:indolepyruvate oxidoreductase subunit beta [Desulfurococcus mucosus]ADV65074.1 Pyruvate/ketoisovalerate oxidoreductase, catalytic domain protein [Desulfurococcus mucosus DSM 2162]
MKTRFNLVLIGVGGQGIITLGRLIGLGCMHRGVDVSVAEVHGMSQRGGSVVVHVRIGEGESPIIPVAGAHSIIAMEMLESVRSLVYANNDTTLVINDFLWPPPLSKYPSREAILTAISGKGLRHYVYDANKASMEVTGSPISSNVALLGFTLAVDKELSKYISLEDVEWAIGRAFRGAVAEINKRLLRKSYEDGLKNAT